jgi:hypothetical protein
VTTRAFDEHCGLAFLASFRDHSDKCRQRVPQRSAEQRQGANLRIDLAPEDATYRRLSDARFPRERILPGRATPSAPRVLRTLTPRTIHAM